MLKKILAITFYSIGTYQKNFFRYGSQNWIERSSSFLGLIRSILAGLTYVLLLILIGVIFYPFLALTMPLFPDLVAKIVKDAWKNRTYELDYFSALEKEVYYV